MPKLDILNDENRPEYAADTIAQIKNKTGFVPGVMGAMANSPEAAEAYTVLGDLLQRSAFTPEARHVAWFTINMLPDCRYCMAAHTAIAKREKIDETVIETARAGGDYDDPHLQALKVFTTRMVEDRGWVQPEVVQAFLDAGYTQRHVMDVILAISHKVLSNYTNHLAQTPLDEPFKPFAWTPSAANAAE